MRIGQLAGATGVSTDTIRYYEKIGLLPAPQRTESGYREYPAGAGNRIRVIRNAVQLGFPLEEVAKVLRLRDAGGAPCRQVRDYASGLVGEIDRRIGELTVERAAMVEMIRVWDRKLTQARGERAHLLENTSLVVRGARPKHARLRQRRR
jgi:DNA-binding transcriptional MerR regulator